MVQDVVPHKDLGTFKLGPLLFFSLFLIMVFLFCFLQENVRFKYRVNYTINDQDYTDTGEVDSLLAPR